MAFPSSALPRVVVELCPSGSKGVPPQCTVSRLRQVDTTTDTLDRACRGWIRAVAPTTNNQQHRHPPKSKLNVCR